MHPESYPRSGPVPMVRGTNGLQLPHLATQEELDSKFAQQSVAQTRLQSGASVNKECLPRSRARRGSMGQDWPHQLRRTVFHSSVIPDGLCL